MSKINKLLVERYRPTTIDEYVFPDEATKKKVMKWIEKGELPHVLLAGMQGVGKCLDRNEPVEIRVELDELPEHIRMKLIKYL